MNMEGKVGELPNKGGKRQRKGIPEIHLPPPLLWALPQKNSHRNYGQVTWDIHSKIL